MKLKDLLLLRPFDETNEKITKANFLYSNSIVLSALILGGSICSVISLISEISGERNAIIYLGLAIVINALLAGGEWAAGLKVRASNKLFETAFFALAFFLVSLI